ncbi:integrase core domain-containing protein, partial [Corynebacterium striatum]
ATPADRGAANINYERKPLAVPGTWNPGTNYADSRYQLPQIDSPYTSQAFRSYCSSLGVRQSMGAVGTSADNALAESFNATLKREVLRDRKVFDNPIICRQEVFRWCMRYNTRRRHSWCNLLAPDDFEALTSATLTKAA